MLVSHLAIYGDYLYFADDDHQTLTKVHKITGKNGSPVLAPKLPHLTDLISVSLPSPQVLIFSKELFFMLQKVLKP